jgi:flagellar hook-length control protein FliK
MQTDLIHIGSGKVPPGSVSRVNGHSDDFAGLVRTSVENDVLTPPWHDVHEPSHAAESWVHDRNATTVTGAEAHIPPIADITFFDPSDTAGEFSATPATVLGGEQPAPVAIDLLAALAVAEGTIRPAAAAQTVASQPPLPATAPIPDALPGDPDLPDLPDLPRSIMQPDGITDPGHAIAPLPSAAPGATAGASTPVAIQTQPAGDDNPADDAGPVSRQARAAGGADTPLLAGAGEPRTADSAGKQAYMQPEQTAAETAGGPAQRTVAPATEPASTAPSTVPGAILSGAQPGGEGGAGTHAHNPAAGNAASPVSAFGGELRGPADPAAAVTQGAARAVAEPAIEQLAVRISRAMNEGIDRFTIQMRPAELGQVSVRLELGHDHRVIAVIAAERSDTLELLQRDARALERALQQAGLNADSGSLSFESRGERGPGNPFGEDDTPAREFALPEETGEALPGASDTMAWQLGADRLDIRI